jgi:hypothetical protein
MRRLPLLLWYEFDVVDMCLDGPGSLPPERQSKNENFSKKKEDWKEKYEDVTNSHPLPLSYELAILFSSPVRHVIITAVTDPPPLYFLSLLASCFLSHEL